MAGGTLTRSFDGHNQKMAVPAGVTSDPVFVGQLAVVTAVPGAGGSMLVEASFSSGDDVRGNTANWFAWDNGTNGVVSAGANQLLQRATAVRFTAFGVAGVGEVAQ